MNISKKPLLIGLIVISFVILIFFGYSNNIRHEENYEKIFSESNKDSSLEKINFFNLDNKELFLTDFKDKVLLVNL